MGLRTSLRRKRNTAAAQGAITDHDRFMVEMIVDDFMPVQYGDRIGLGDAVAHQAQHARIRTQIVAPLGTGEARTVYGRYAIARRATVKDFLWRYQCIVDIEAVHLGRVRRACAQEQGDGEESLSVGK